MNRFRIRWSSLKRRTVGAARRTRPTQTPRLAVLAPRLSSIPSPRTVS